MEPIRKIFIDRINAAHKQKYKGQFSFVWALSPADRVLFINSLSLDTVSLLCHTQTISLGEWIQMLSVLPLTDQYRIYVDMGSTAHLVATVGTPRYLPWTKRILNCRRWFCPKVMNRRHLVIDLSESGYDVLSVSISRIPNTTYLPPLAEPQQNAMQLMIQ